MANDYFIHLDNIIPKGSRATAAQVNNIADEIAVGLDKLPTESELKQGELNYSTDTGIANAYVITLGYVPTLTDGLKVAVKVTNANTGSCTLDVNATGEKALKHADGVDLAEGDLVDGQIFESRYDGTEYRIIAKESSAAGIKTLYESNSDTNEYTDAEETKLAGIETAATADQTAAEIKTAYESNTDTNEYTDAEKTKVGTVETDANNYSHPSHTGDVTSSGDGAQTITNNAVTLPKMADMATASFLGRLTAGTGDPQVLSAASARSILNIENGSTADQTNAEIRAAVEAATDSNVFTNADHTKLDKIYHGRMIAGSLTVHGGSGFTAAIGATTLEITHNFGTQNYSVQMTLDSISLPGVSLIAMIVPVKDTVGDKFEVYIIDESGNDITTSTGSPAVAFNFTLMVD
ncbi:MAG: hypothetical protein IMF17_07655 [Proteobacteria bacterium]|nr:hypothetical protein [Pseudomonadota bacterium]